MGHFVEIGDNAGEAAPGEYSPHAMLTTRGDIIVRDSTGVPVRKALGAAGLFAGSDGTDLLYRYPPGYPTLTDLGKTYTGDGASNPETSILNGGAAISAVYPAGVAIGDAFDISLRGNFLNNSGSNKTVLINLYYGSYVLMAVTTPNLTTSATTRVWGCDLRVVVEVVGAGSAGKVRLFGQRYGLDGIAPAATGWVNPSAATQWGYNDGVTSGTNASLVTNAAGAFNVTATHSTNANTIATTLSLCQVRWLPKNY